MRSVLVSVVVSVALFTACSKSPEPTPTPTPDKPAETMMPPMPLMTPPTNTHAMPQAANAGDTAQQAGDVTYEPPAAWSSQPNPSPMRKATYKIPKVAGDADDGELTVSVAGGGVDPNVKRWASQFGDAAPKTESRTVNGLKVTMIEIKGTFASGGMGQPSVAKEKQMLLGAIVDLGARQHFFKMVGPEKTITAAKAAFDKFVSSFRVK